MSKYPTLTVTGISDNCPSCGVRVDLEHAPYCAAWAGMRNPDPKPVTRRVALERLTPDEVLAAFAALPPTVRFKAVADGMDEFFDMALDRGPMGGTSFKRHADQMREVVAQWEAEDAVGADRKHLVEEIARALYKHHYAAPVTWDACPDWLREKYLRDARALLERFDITPKEKP